MRDLLFALQAMLDSIRNIPDSESALGMGGFVSFHEALIDLCRYGSSYPHGGFRIAVQKLKDQHLERLLELAELANAAFERPIVYEGLPLAEMRRKLKSVLELRHKPQYENVMQTKLLVREAEYWLRQIDNMERSIGARTGDCVFGLLPSTDMDYRGDAVSSGGAISDHKFYVRFAIWSTSSEPVWIDRLRIGFSDDSSPRAEFALGNIGRLWTTGIEGASDIPVSDPGEIIVEMLRIDEMSIATIDVPIFVPGDNLGAVTLSCSFGNPSEGETSARIPVLPAIVEHGTERKANRQRNPFVAGRTLVWPSEEGGSGGQILANRDIVEGLLDQILNADQAMQLRGRIVQICGLNGTGKSTIARAMFRRARAEMAPVYVDLKEWSERRIGYEQHSDEPFNVFDLLYEFCIQALRDAVDYVNDEVWLQLRDISEAEDIIQFSSETSNEELPKLLPKRGRKVDVRVFSRFFQKFLAITSRKTVLFILDGAEDWYAYERDRHAHHNSQSLRSAMRELDRGQNVLRCAFVFFDRPTMDGVFTAFGKERPPRNQIEFLDKKSLIDAIDQWCWADRMTSSARTLVWRYTGGWLEPFQALMSEIHERVKSRFESDSANSGMIDACDVREAARTFNDPSHYNCRLLRALLESLEATELARLRGLCVQDRLDRDTLIVSAPRQSDAAFMKLIDEQILTFRQDGRETALTLRVGLLAVADLAFPADSIANEVSNGERS